MKKFYFLSTVFIAFLLFAGSVRTMAITGGTVIQPTSTGIVWIAGNTYNITWTALNPLQAVDIYLSDDDSFEFATDTKIFDNVTSTTTSVSWAIPGGQDVGDYWIFITTADDGAPDPNPVAIDGSNNSFEIAATGPGGTGTIHVNQPNVSGIQWAPGQEVGIYWDYDLGLDVKLELYYDESSPTLVSSGVSGLPASVSGSGYIWTIPITIPERTDYLIRVSSTTTSDEDYSDNEFSITTSPVGGSYITLIQPEEAGIQWVPGTTRLISWDDDLLENVKIELLEYDGVSAYALHSVLSPSAAGTTYDWDIPELLDENTYKIRISSTDAGTSVLPVTSTNAFEITNTPSGGSTITLIQPEVAGLQWLNEGTYVISWIDDLIEDVKIQLLEDDGITLVDPSDSGIPDALYAGTTWDWTIPDATTLIPGDYKIRIYSSANGSIEAISTNPFEVASAPNGGTYIDLIQPNIAGIEWASGTDHLVSWMDDLLEPVSFELWYDPGTGYEQYIGTTGLPSDVEGTTFIWSIPDAATLLPGTYKIRAESSYDGIIFDLGEEFEIVEFQPGGEITLYQPNGGEEWQIGGTYLISWTDNVSEPVMLEYTLNGIDWIVIANSVEGSTYSWNTATTATPASASTTCMVRVTSTTQSGITDESDNDFSFVASLGGDVEVISPNGGEQWVPGNTYYIVWNDELAENVYIKLWKLSEGDFIDAAIANLPAYDGSGVAGTVYEWTIPEGVLTNGDDYTIYIESVLDGAYWDESDLPFTITDEPSGGTYVTVNTPNGGEVWTLGETRIIWWDDDLIENVDIDLVDADDDFIAEIANDVPSIGNYEWIISSVSYGVGTYKVHIYSHTGGAGSIEDFSDATFTLIEGKSPLSNLLENGTSATYAMYPNPVSNMLNVASTNTIERIQVQSLIGQIVYESDVDATETTINVQEFTPGIYVVMIECAGVIETQKLIVK
jgi:hypothetical protein